MSRRLLLIALFASVIMNGCLFILWRDATPLRYAATIASPVPSRSPGAPAIAASFVPATLARTETELAGLRTQLESLGLSPQIVRDVLLSTMNVFFRQKRDELIPPFDLNEYWRNPDRRPEGDHEIAEREMQRDWNKLRRQFIGDDFDDEPKELIRRLGHLPAEKVARVRKVLADYSDLEKELFVSEADGEGPEYRAIARERRADLERLLTPEELVGYDLRNSPASDRLRNRLGNFAATEAEFRALHPTFQAVTRDLADPAWNAGSQRSAREEELHLEAEMRRVLGEARFAELKDANDDLLRETRKLTTALNLPPKTAAEIITVQKEFTAKLRAIDRNRELTGNERDVQAVALGTETRDRLVSLLGPNNWETYQRRGGSLVSSAMSRRPTPPAPPR